MIPAGMRLCKATATDATSLIVTLALVLCALQHQATIFVPIQPLLQWFHGNDVLRHSYVIP